tara:strand:- start:47711 stop:48964 length:1254 start_codon:yes stop_codon:yes gene_type:complete
MSYCGLDFGTSNSTLGHMVGEKPALLALESGKVTLPSAIFYNFDSNDVYYGRAAIGEYVDGEYGRLMRSIKSVLGTPLMHDKTIVKGKPVAFTDIISHFIEEMKIRAQKQSGQAFDQVVMGRPVYFVDGDVEADLSAQNALEKAAKQAGFKDVLFQYEPIAAALDYEQGIQKEELALIVDLGGGTSDFSVVRLCPTKSKNIDRKQDILATGGVHIGGTDFDRHLSLHSVMPHFGYRSPYKEDPKMEMPISYHHDLATWHKIHFLYDKETLAGLKSLAMRMEKKHLVDRLICLIEEKEGHRLAMGVEKAKIDLTMMQEALMVVDYVGDDFDLHIKRDDLHSAIQKDVVRIDAHIRSTVADAGVALGDITKIFMTGGSTAIPLIREMVVELFPGVEVVDGDRFGSVGVGLALDAQKRFA